MFISISIESYTYSGLYKAQCFCLPLLADGVSGEVLHYLWPGEDAPVGEGGDL